MPTINKEDNQYYGKYFEKAVVDAINKNDFSNNTGFNFSEKDLDELNKDAIICANFINAKSATWIGNHTTTELGDILLDTGEHIELKYVKAGTGTYHNTSLSYFEKYGFNFQSYMKKFGLYKALSEMKEISYSEKNKSPVTQSQSSNIRHKIASTQEIAEYNYNIYEKEILPINKQMILAFKNDIISYLKENNLLKQFIFDMINKVKAGEESELKGIADRYIIFNYKTKIPYELKIKENIDYSNINNDEEEQSVTIDNFIKITFSWQNGVGLHNPTIRVFLK